MAMDLKEIENLIKVKLNNTKWCIIPLKVKWEMNYMPLQLKQRNNNG
jgi:nitrogen regulatory protein PII-like uncharacterized protein